MSKKYLKTSKKSISLLLILLLFTLVVSGCIQKKEVVEDPSEDEIVQEEDQGDTRIIKDMAGREIEIPKEINKVFTTSPVGTIALYSINPSLIAGLNGDVTAFEEKYLTEEYTSLPILGRYKASDSGNEEEILKAAPDIILSMGDVNERWISEADEAQEKLGIPFLMIDGNLEKTAEMYEFLGDILGEEEKAKALSDYSRSTIEDTMKIGKTIPEDEKISVYYGSTKGPLTTNVTGSIHTGTIDLIGAKNAAEVTVEKMSGGVDVSMEQVLEWNPDLIIAAKAYKNENGSYETIIEDPTWSILKAVEDKNVYAIPNAPFNWFDQPPSVNRIIGVRWLGNLVYPEYFDIDIKQETKDFYELFYHRVLTDDEVEEVLEGAIRK